MTEVMRKEIEGTDGRYFITTKGTVENKNGEEIRQNVVNGYKTFYYNKKNLPIHRLVAQAFIENPNPEEFTSVDHINRDKLDNRLENLRWANARMQAQNRDNLRVSRERKTVYKYSLDGEFIGKYASGAEAARSCGPGKTTVCILGVCQGRTKTAYGYKWSYDPPEPTEEPTEETTEETTEDVEEIEAEKPTEAATEDGIKVNGFIVGLSRKDFEELLEESGAEFTGEIRGISFNL